MSDPVRVVERRSERRELRDGGRRRRRGGARRGPVLVQRLARSVSSYVVTVRRAVAAAVSGDRPLVVALLGAVVLAGVLLSGPTQNYLDSRARVEVLQMQADALGEENRRLSERVEDLRDEETIELLAREQQGFIRPGEVPYAVVAPEVDRPRITDSRDDAATGGAAAMAETGPWYQRAWTRLQRLLGGGV